MNSDSKNQEAVYNTLNQMVLYEDDTYICINKPAGIAVHGDGRTEMVTVADWLLDRCPETEGVGEVQYSQSGEAINRSGIVHRLDRDTSGVLLLVKNQTAHEQVKYQFQNRLVKKYYRAFVYGEIKDRWGTIDRTIGKSASDFRKWSAEHGKKGLVREAVTHWESIGSGEVEGQKFSYLSLRPVTGRTHQLRVHLKAIGRPIVQDTLYAEKLSIEAPTLGFTRLALHAHELSISLPEVTVEKFIAPLPMEFEVAAEAIAGQG